MIYVGDNRIKVSYHSIESMPTISGDEPSTISKGFLTGLSSASLIFNHHDTITNFSSTSPCPDPCLYTSLWLVV